MRAGVELIAEGLAHNGTVLSLDLSSNNITNVGAIDLAEALHSDKCKLLELRLANNRIGMDEAKRRREVAATIVCIACLVLWLLICVCCKLAVSSRAQRLRLHPPPPTTAIGCCR